MPPSRNPRRLRPPVPSHSSFISHLEHHAAFTEPLLTLAAAAAAAAAASREGSTLFGGMEPSACATFDDLGDAELELIFAAVCTTPRGYRHCPGLPVVCRRWRDVYEQVRSNNTVSKLLNDKLAAASTWLD